ncbi:MAG: hypothetical protein ACIAZJ_04890 [Gimesia chilikensis]|uniref:hypothetical protein n=1 Tax=Gimesia chilikensis TaxID=2605989 RepID=UPI003789445A
MSCQARFLRDGTIEIQTDEGDCLILTMDEACIFQIEIENALFTIFSDNQTNLENRIPIVVNDMTFSLEDAEQLASSLDELLSREGRGPRMEINWHRIGY